MASEIEALGQSPALEALRKQTEPGSFQDTVVAELQVIRGVLARLVVAVSGDAVMGHEGLVARVRAQALSVGALERDSAMASTVKDTKSGAWKIVAGTIAATSAAIYIGNQIFTWAAH